MENDKKAQDLAVENADQVGEISTEKVYTIQPESTGLEKGERGGYYGPGYYDDRRGGCCGCCIESLFCCTLCLSCINNCCICMELCS